MNIILVQLVHVHSQHGTENGLAFEIICFLLYLIVTTGREIWILFAVSFIVLTSQTLYTFPSVLGREAALKLPFLADHQGRLSKS